MADTVDVANRYARQLTEHKVAEICARAQVPELELSDHCHHCGEELTPRRLFCNAVCAVKHDQEQRRC